MYALTAVLANQVMVMFAWFYELVSALSVAQIYCLDQSFANERFQRAIDGRQTWCFVVLVAHQSVDILSAGQFMDLFQNIENLFTAFS
jgi:hypothetical protein